MAIDSIPTKAGALGVRGVSYPAISLEAAVKRARQLWDHERKNSAPLEAVATHWGYSPTSSGVRTAVAALLSFGLVSDHGSSGTRHIQLTPRGLDIVLETPERNAALIEAVTSPKIYSELLTLWPADNLPSDQTLKVHLLRHKNFNPKAVDGFIQDFKDSIGFSGLSKAANMPSVATLENRDRPEMQPQMGEHSYGDRFDSAAPLGPQGPAPGERQWLSGDLNFNSTPTKCRVLITGEIGVDEIAVLIELLEVQKRIREKKRGGEKKAIDQAREDTGKA